MSRVARPVIDSEVNTQPFTQTEISKGRSRNSLRKRCQPEQFSKVTSPNLCWCPGAACAPGMERKLQVTLWQYREDNSRLYIKYLMTFQEFNVKLGKFGNKHMTRSANTKIKTEVIIPFHQTTRSTPYIKATLLDTYRRRFPVINLMVQHCFYMEHFMPEN